MLLEVEFKHAIDCKLHINDMFVEETLGLKLHKFSIDTIPANIKIFINPYKIQPIIRVDDVMLNYGLAGITPWDHMIEFNYDNKFFKRYQDAIIKSKMSHFNLTDTSCQEYDYYIGIGKDYKELINEIHEILDESIK